MPKRNEKANVSLGNVNSKTKFTINQYDDIEIKVIVDDICSIEQSNLTLHIEKPSGEKDKSATLKTVMDNIAEFEVNGSVFNEPGLHKAQLKISDSGGSFKSTIFLFNVLESIIDDISPIPPVTTKRAVCGGFECGELLCGEGLETQQLETKSNLSEKFFKSFGGGLNEQ
ncbi:hypothetical protein QDQ76_05755 [Clostridium perfringens]|uniref:hypothetical protein n=1 Tax=Clostridium perfringens TaxID=1502 RepID=UPI00244ACF5A|nr:hypothetical protein [Clostridium perfringens]MDH2338725.1 hypothetical protein [Clostridium perfringens]